MSYMSHPKHGMNAMSEPETLLFRMTIDQANLVLEALGQMPYIKVHRLIEQMQAQAKQQLEQRAQDDAGAQVLSALAGAGGPGDGGGQGKVIDAAG